jgi:deazaflavin-dependent oxidoreductase (nitroreductase family)
LLLLHTKGAKSALPRTNPLVYLPDGDRYVVIASKGGAPTHPDWYYSLLADPDAAIEIGNDERIPVRAIVHHRTRARELYARQIERPQASALLSNDPRFHPAALLNARRKGAPRAAPQT